MGSANTGDSLTLLFQEATAVQPNDFKLFTQLLFYRNFSTTHNLQQLLQKPEPNQTHAKPSPTTKKKTKIAIGSQPITDPCSPTPPAFPLPAQVCLRGSANLPRLADPNPKGHRLTPGHLAPPGCSWLPSAHLSALQGRSLAKRAAAAPGRPPASCYQPIGCHHPAGLLAQATLCLVPAGQRHAIDMSCNFYPQIPNPNFILSDLSCYLIFV